MLRMKIWFATNNIHKKKELQSILNRSLSLPSESRLNFNPDETGSNFLDNALLKARILRILLGNKKNDLIIADDSGLCVDALGGRPGVHSSRYGEVKGKKLTSQQQNNMLLDELGDNPIRTARFVCAMILLFDENRFFAVQETIEGEIVKNPNSMKGTGGFGYDPVFLIPKFSRTLAELSADEKNSISHRGKAGRIIKELLNNFK